ncbi:hypothetical protein CK203_015466 [Vitis vinifera]|uniref:Uncharacterized protein n=1 Tax=Vitis vinifera TaxID=29760 RepID=A0A438JJV1_VITVI|nr:hypothetical protein CK203_015466 [Vitis vinifera]
MDFKGITWVGNMYQKFETICLEVEDIMYQDTVKYFENHVKYVEDQVETVGESVKKFCSEIVQDLLLPDSLEVTDSNLSLDQHDNVKLCKKPKVGIKEEAKVGIKEEAKVGFKEEPKVSIKEEFIKFDIDRLTEHSEIADLNEDVEHKSSFTGLHGVNNLFQSYSGNSVTGACSDLHLVQNDDGVMCKNLDAGDVSRLPSSLNENCENKCNQMAITSSPASVEITECNLEGAICNEIADVTAISVDLPSVPLVESVGKEGREMVFSSRGGLSSELNAGNIPMDNGVGSLIGSFRDIQHNETAEKDLLSHSEGSDGWNIDAIEINDVIEQGIETTKDLLDKMKLEDACVMVDGDELHVVSHREGKVWLVKKKLRNAFYSKRRLARKEYERLAVWHRVIDSESNQPGAEGLTPSPSTDSDKRTSPDDDFCQSEWELL